MSEHTSASALGLTGACAVCLAFSFNTILAQPVLLSTHTSNGTDTSYVGVPLEIVFHLDANGIADIAGVVVPMELHFSSGNILGPVDLNQQFFWLPAAAVFELKGLSSGYVNATDPDTIFFRLLSGGPPPEFNGSGDVCKIVVQPMDTGHIMFADVLLPPANVLEAYDYNVVRYEVDWNRPSIVVEPCPSELMGDVNQSGTITSADIVYLVAYTFLSGSAPLPVALAGDANCDRRITASDIILIVNHVFRSGPPPCPCNKPGP